MIVSHVPFRSDVIVAIVRRAAQAGDALDASVVREPGPCAPPSRPAAPLSGPQVHAYDSTAPTGIAPATASRVPHAFRGATTPQPRDLHERRSEVSVPTSGGTPTKRRRTRDLQSRQTVRADCCRGDSGTPGRRGRRAGPLSGLSQQVGDLAGTPSAFETRAETVSSGSRHRARSHETWTD